MKARIIKYAENNGLLVGFTSYENYKLNNKSKFKSDFEFAKSIVSIAMPVNRSENVVASYATGKDYHYLVKEHLSVIEKLIDAQSVSFVDNGPVDDKLCAYLAGIGHYSTNELITAEKYGTYIVIGNIFTDYKFEVDKSSLKSCLKCNLCVKHCPTQAIGDVYNKCLAGSLQRKKKFDYQKVTRIYGCDTCQKVCPQNNNKNILDQHQKLDINIFDLLKCPKKEFNKYSEYAFYWLGHNLIKRNIILYAKNKNINIDDYLKYVLSKESYMLDAINYYRGNK